MASELAVAGGVVGGVGALYTGQAESDALNRAATIQQQNAALDIQAGDVNAQMSAMRASRALGHITTAYGGNGVASDSGSALSVLAASSANAELEKQNILHGAKVRAINAENQASMDAVGAESALKGSYLSAFGSLIGGGAKAFGYSAGPDTTKYVAPNAHGQDASDLEGGVSEAPIE